jgi:senataxin
MHPMISKLPSALFYQARLKDGPDMEQKTAKPWHHDSKFGVYRFLDIKSVEEKSGRSIKNIPECRIAVALFARLRKAFSSIDFDGQVGGTFFRNV